MNSTTILIILFSIILFLVSRYSFNNLYNTINNTINNIDNN